MNLNLSLLLLAILIANTFAQASNKTECDLNDIETYKGDNFLDESCFLCLKPVCSADETEANGCMYMAPKAKSIPLYTNVLEYGVMPIYLDGTIAAKVSFGSGCSVEVSTVKFENNSFTSMVKIIEPEIDDNIIYQKLVNTTDKTVVTFTVLFDFDKKIHIQRSTDVSKLSTAYHDDDDYTISKDTCKYDMYTKLTVDYKLTHSKKVGPDDPSKLIAVPCSPGGYIVEVETGMLATDENYIKKTFKEKTLLDKAVEKFYDNRKLEFYSAAVDSTKRKPIYIGDDNQPLSVEKMYSMRDVTLRPTKITTEMMEPKDKDKETTVEEAKAGGPQSVKAGPFVLALFLALVLAPFGFLPI